MSEIEFDQGNEELFAVVNGHAAPEAAKQAEEVARRAAEVAAAKAKAEEEARKREIAAAEEAEAKKNRRKEIRAMIVRMLALTLAAVLFLAALLLPNWVPVLCFGGLAVCLIVGAIVTDRAIRAWR